MIHCPKIKNFNDLANKFTSPSTPVTSLRDDEKFRPTQSAISHHSSEFTEDTLLSPNSHDRLVKLSVSEKMPVQSSEIFSPSNCKSKTGKIRNFLPLKTGAKTITSPEARRKIFRTVLTSSAASPKHRPKSASTQSSSTQRNYITSAPALRISTKIEPVDNNRLRQSSTLKVQTSDKAELSNNLSPTLKERFSAGKKQSFAFSPIKSLGARDNLIKTFLETKVRTTSLSVQN